MNAVNSHYKITGTVFLLWGLSHRVHVCHQSPALLVGITTPSSSMSTEGDALMLLVDCDVSELQQIQNPDRSSQVQDLKARV